MGVVTVRQARTAMESEREEPRQAWEAREASERVGGVGLNHDLCDWEGRGFRGANAQRPRRTFLGILGCQTANNK